jgi:hypothetical protein
MLAIAKNIGIELGGALCPRSVSVFVFAVFARQQMGAKGLL